MYELAYKHMILMHNHWLIKNDLHTLADSYKCLNWLISI